MSTSLHPLADPHQLVEDACTKARLLADQALDADHQLREARRELAAFERDLAETSLAEPRVMAEAKAAALRTYRQRRAQAVTADEVSSCATQWLAELDRLNRAALRLTGRAGALNDRIRHAEALVAKLELSARAASVAAEHAREACLRARRAQAGRDEALMGDDPIVLQSLRGGGGLGQGDPSITTLIKGERSAVEALAAQLADDAGVDRGRLQLLLLELREAIIDSALEASLLDFPADHPFWSQFTRTDARSLVAALAVLGHRFDGRAGWHDGNAPEPREFALAISLSGQDPRSLRQRPSRLDLAGLWRGTTVGALEMLHDRAPELGLTQILTVIGPRGDALGELWECWGSLRHSLLTPRRSLPAA
jgi:hypothetical protein